MRRRKITVNTAGGGPVNSNFGNDRQLFESIFTKVFSYMCHHADKGGVSWRFTKLEAEQRPTRPLSELPDDALWRQVGLWGKVT